MTRAMLLAAGCVAMAAAAPLAAGSEGASSAPLLHLHNGDSLHGRLVDSAEPGVLAWHAEAMASPFLFPLSAVSGAHFPKQDKVDSGAEYAFELSGGDVVLGSLVALTADGAEIDSREFGRLKVERSHLLRISRLGDQKLARYQGPDGLAAWATADKEVWSEETGHLLARTPGVITLPNCEIPPRARIEVELSWQKKPDFALAFGGHSAMKEAVERLKGVEDIAAALVNLRRTPQQPAAKPASLFGLEVWGSRSLVLVREQSSDADLALVKAFGSFGPGRIWLQLLYDQQLGHIAAYSADGKLLAEVTVPAKGDIPANGVRLENKGGDIRLERLVIEEWAGGAPSEVDPSRSYLQRSGGEILYTDAAVFDPAAREFVAPQPEGEPLRIAAGDLERLVLASSAPVERCTVRASFRSGARLSGRLLGVAEGRLRLSRPGVDAEVTMPITDLWALTSLEKAVSEAPAGRLGRFEAPGTRLRGVLTGAEPTADALCLAWQPQGSKTASAIRRGVSGSIIYRDPPAKVAERPVQQQAGQANVAVFMAAPRAVVEQPGRVPRIRSVRDGDGDQQEDQLLWLRGGDRITCRLKSIDQRGVTFESSQVEVDSLPHDRIKAWEQDGHASRANVDEKKRERLLTLPRMLRKNPPTHLVQSHSGDYLRGRLESLDDKQFTMEVRLEPVSIAKDQVTRIIWLEPPAPPVDQGDEADEAKGDAPADAEETLMQAVRRDGVRLTFRPDRIEDSTVIGSSQSLGACQVQVDQVDQLYFGDAIEQAARELVYHDWRLRPAPDPRYVQEEDAPAGAAPREEAALADKPAPSFKLELLAGGQFDLERERGHVVVLDFWASWCGPCMHLMPQMDEVAQELAGPEVRFIAVNMQEDRETIADALERLNLKPEVALDVDGATAEKYAVTAIPQTVVIDRQGNVSAVLIGSRSDFADNLRAAIQAAMGAATDEATAPEEPAGEIDPAAAAP